MFCRVLFYTMKAFFLELFCDIGFADDDFLGSRTDFNGETHCVISLVILLEIFKST